MEPEKKIIDAYNELQEKYSSIQICDMLDKKIKNDVSEKTVVRVLSYYLVGPTTNSPPIPDPLERESNEIASDVERAMRCAPPDLRFDHKIFYEERRKGQENDRPELFRIDEFSADKSCASGDFRLTMLLTCLESSDLLIFHKFLACSEIKTKRIKPPKKNDAQISASREDEIFNAVFGAKYSDYWERELVEIVAQMLYVNLSRDAVYQKVKENVGDENVADEIFQKGCERCEETQEMRRRMLTEGDVTKDDEEEYRARLKRWLLDLKYGYWDDFDHFDDDLYVDE